ncbi:class III extradiol ring-cleavage dioxygenase [Franzmannia qiaohouensis]|uniref:Class III extradiol ring-cleavage dioxygenase n=1 Tax=Franzmannia qiaohouensis TaxID=1329370 RepID=A0ABU1HBJ1_9GAMM|nr:class III extradiol ring-cleavage dioxygenase [Halomonas qiaohouensis]MDR5904833.1 class III extradiol ring-cleavage dioxygenase [Halomonas qiaohouensis]
MVQSLFISHGSPSLVISDHPARAFLVALGPRLPRPRGALVISAHFETPGVTLGSAAAPATLHDFYGFPDSLYRMRYPAPGMPDTARQLADTLQGHGIAASLDPERPLDHGIWSPLSLVWPEAEVPLLPVSVPMAMTAQQQLEVARRLGEFADTHGLWLIGSGAATHNLGDRRPEGSPPDAWALAFHDWASEVAERGDLAALADWQRQAPAALHAHPSPEHFLPLLMVVGAMQGEPLRALHQSFSFGNLSMLTLASQALADQWSASA